VVVNKMDLLPFVDFDLQAYRRLLLSLNPDVALFPVSCKTNVGINAWADWLKQELAQTDPIRSGGGTGRAQPIKSEG
jgi:hydrogenase nickel incorporation protein HypB